MNDINLTNFFELNLSLLKNNNSNIIKDLETLFINSKFNEKEELFNNKNRDYFYNIIINSKNKNIIIEFIKYLDEKKELIEVFSSYSNILIDYIEYIPNKIIFFKLFLEKELFYSLNISISKKIYDYIINNNNILLLLLNNNNNIKSLIILSNLLFIHDIDNYYKYYKFLKFIIVFLIENNKINLFTLDELKKIIENNRKLLGMRNDDIKKNNKLLLDKNKKIINVYYYYNLLFLYLLNNENINESFLNQIKIDIINNNMQNFYIKLCDSNLEATLLILLYHKNSNNNLVKIIILNITRFILFCNEKKLKELEEVYKKEILKILKEYKVIIKKELKKENLIQKFNKKIKYLKG